jgi:hypothetical protein
LLGAGKAATKSCERLRGHCEERSDEAIPPKSLRMLMAWKEKSGNEVIFYPRMIKDFISLK